jgi:folate-dependent phosphoribosylglycinamide formyltransferase PurN
MNDHVPPARPLRLAYLMSLRNATADKAGQWIDVHGEMRYMKSPLQFVVELLETRLRGVYDLRTIIYDDDPLNPADSVAVADYGFRPRNARPWIFPLDLALPDGAAVLDLMCNIPSSYRRLPRADHRRPADKRQFEDAVLDKLRQVEADVVLVDGLLVILDNLIREGSPYHHRIVNIHPGITREGSPFQRRGLYATKDALWGARGKRVVDWELMEMRDVVPIARTGASLHFIDHGIDSGEVIYDVLETRIDRADTIYELRWNNFHQSMFPALEHGLLRLAKQLSAVADAALPAEVGE